MPLREIRNKAIRGETITNGDIVICLGDAYDQTEEHSDEIQKLKDRMKAGEAATTSLFESIKAFNDNRIADAARHSGLMVLPKLGWKAISFVGVGPILTLGLFCWHVGSESHDTKTAAVETKTIIDNHTIELENQRAIIIDNQKAILKLLDKAEAFNDASTARDKKHGSN
jgi:hypothetical protein